MHKMATDKHKDYYLFFDTETTGLPKRYNSPSSDTDNWPRMVQLSWIMADEKGTEVSTGNYIIQPVGFSIPKEASDINGITTARAMAEGESLCYVMDRFMRDLDDARTIVGHNVEFDIKVVGAEMIRLGREDVVGKKPFVCTMKASANFCKLYGKHGYKWPRLEELHRKLFHRGFRGAHDAMNDVEATLRCFFELKRLGIIKDGENLASESYDGHKYVDLGLSVKWATCNVGASRPEECGDYYAWGETETKARYDEDDCETYGEDIGDIGGTDRDVAHVKWGGTWRMPTEAECRELKVNCDYEWTTQNGVNGYKITSKKNGKSIFLPAAGWRLRASLSYTGSGGYYWNSTPAESNNRHACSLSFDFCSLYTSRNYRRSGQSVRPVSP